MSRLPRSGTAAAPVTIRATADERAAWEASAMRAGKTLSDWARTRLNRAAARAALKILDGGKR